MLNPLALSPPVGAALRIGPGNPRGKLPPLLLAVPPHLTATSCTLLLLLLRGGCMRGPWARPRTWAWAWSPAPTPAIRSTATASPKGHPAARLTASAATRGTPRAQPSPHALLSVRGSRRREVLRRLLSSEVDGAQSVGRLDKERCVPHLRNGHLHRGSAGRKLLHGPQRAAELPYLPPLRRPQAPATIAVLPHPCRARRALLGLMGSGGPGTSGRLHAALCLPLGRGRVSCCGLAPPVLSGPAPSLQWRRGVLATAADIACASVASGDVGSPLLATGAPTVQCARSELGAGLGGCRPLRRCWRREHLPLCLTCLLPISSTIWRAAAVAASGLRRGLR